MKILELIGRKREMEDKIATSGLILPHGLKIWRFVVRNATATAASTCICGSRPIILVQNEIIASAESKLISTMIIVQRPTAKVIGLSPRYLPH